MSDTLKVFKKFIEIQKEHEKLNKLNSKIKYNEEEENEYIIKHKESKTYKNTKIESIQKDLKLNEKLQDVLIPSISVVALFFLFLKDYSSFFVLLTFFCIIVNVLLIQRHFLKSKKIKKINEMIKDLTYESESKKLLKEANELRKELENHKSLRDIFKYLKSFDEYEIKWYVLLYKTINNKENKKRKHKKEDCKSDINNYIDYERLRKNKLKKDLEMIKRHYSKSKIFND